MTFRTFLTESKEGKNVHLTHINELPFLGGVEGTRSAINFLRSLRDMLAGHSNIPLNVSVKFDGAPAIICGINPENGKFFVGTKGVFAQNPKLNYTSQDIDTNHPGPGLNKKLKLALQYLPELGIKQVLQGDMMFSHEDLVGEKIDGVSYVTFKPNTITYAVPLGTVIAHRILEAKMGIVFHTTYVGKTLQDMKASFNVNILGFSKTKNVWFRTAEIHDVSGTATMTEDETKNLNEILSKMGVLFQNISPAVLNRIAESEALRIPITTFNNAQVREGKEVVDTRQHVLALVHYVEQRANKEIIEAKKAETKQKRELEKKYLLTFFKTYASQLKLIMDLTNLIIEAKLLILRKLDNAQDIGSFIKDDDGFKVIPSEGIVVSDRIGRNAVKLVDQLNFSRANFNAAKDWK